jgi:hypothetical protein
MFRPTTKAAARLLAGAVAAIVLGTSLTGCSDQYLDRRDSIALGAGDAIEGNKVSEIVDPWPPGSGNTNIAFNGEKMQSAVQRYRTGKVIAPGDPENLETTNQSAQSITQTTVNTGGSAAATTTPGQ